MGVHMIRMAFPVVLLCYITGIKLRCSSVSQIPATGFPLHGGNVTASNLTAAALGLLHIFKCSRTIK